jgi:hypothetical protein
MCAWCPSGEHGDTLDVELFAATTARRPADVYAAVARLDLEFLVFQYTDPEGRHRCYVTRQGRDVAAASPRHPLPSTPPAANADAERWTRTEPGIAER